MNQILSVTGRITTVPHVLVTEATIEAGLLAYYQWRDGWNGTTTAEGAAHIFNAMLAAQQEKMK